MPAPISRLSNLTQRYPRTFLALWAVALVAAVPLAARQSDNLSLGGYEVPHSQSSQAEAAIAEHFPTTSRSGLAVLIWPHKHATARDVHATIERISHALVGLPGLTLPKQSREQAEFASGLVGPVVMQLQVAVSEGQTRDLVAIVNKRLSATKSNQISTSLVGESALAAAVADESKHELARAEMIGFPLLLIMLLLIFGSPVAAVLPLVLAGVTITITGALIFLLSQQLLLSTFTADTAVMVGLAVAVDYTLMILVRLRQELRAGSSSALARRVALATSGRAVTYSGLSVIAALAAVWVVPIDALRSMAIGVMLVVAVSLAALLTLLPAVLTILDGKGLTRWRVQDYLPHWLAGRPRWASWETWTRAVTAYPAISLIAAVAVLVPLCLPVFHIKTSTGALEQLSATNATRQAFDRAAKLDGEGFLAPATVVLRSAAGGRDLDATAAALRANTEIVSGIVQVGPLRISAGGQEALFTAVPNANPESTAAERLVESLRQRYQRALAGTGYSVAVGGVSANQLDEQHTINTHMWQVLALMMATIFVILLVLLQSLIIPLKAVVMNLLSLAVAFGTLAAAFQHGWLSDLLSRSPGHVYTLVPPLIVGLVFGLSMDYEVFLLTRIRERWLVSGEPKEAIAEGLAASAGAITGAALILIAAFAVFIGVGIPTIKELGFGAAVSVAVDVTVVRLVIVPAAMTLMARWNWWLPGPLEKLLSVAAAQTSTESVTHAV